MIREPKLLIDPASSIRIQLQESSSGNTKFLTARGEFGRADVPTQNRRTYPRKVWQREIQRIQEAIRAGKVLGHLDHPADGKTSLKHVSHIITALEMLDDGQIVGEAKILDNEHGRQLRSILEANGAVGISSRGLGSTLPGEGGNEIVQEDYTYITHDFVVDPAVITSYPSFKYEVRWVDPASVISEVSVPKEEEMKVESKKVEQVESTEKAPEAAVEEAAVQACEKPESVEKSEEAAPAPEVKEESIKQEPKYTLEEAKAQLRLDPDFAAAIVIAEDVKKFEGLGGKFISLKEHEEKVASLEKTISESNQKISTLEESLVSVSKVSKKLGLALRLSEQKVKMEPSDRALLETMVGDVTKYETIESLDEAVSKAEIAIKTKREIEERAKRELDTMKQVIESHKKEIEELNKSLSEQMENRKKDALRIYAESLLRTHPSASKLIPLCEGKSKEEIDQIVESHKVSTAQASDFEAVRRRFSKFRGTTLVENQLKVEAQKAPAVEVAEGVEKEISDVLSGVTLQEVKTL